MIAGEKLSAAHQAFKNKDYAAAIAEANAALEIDPSAHKAYHTIAMSLSRTGDWEGAVASIEAGLKIAPKDAECLTAYGNLLGPMGRDFDAIAAYKLALDSAPNYLPPALALGQIYLARQDPIQAANVFQTSLTHNEDHPMLLKGLLFALKDAQQFDIAASLLSKIPPSPDTALAAAQIAMGQRQKPVAEANLVKALSHPPSSMQAFRHLIQIGRSKSNGDDQAAVKLVKKFISDNPEAGIFYLYGAELLSEMDYSEDALELIDRAEGKFGENSDTHYVRSKILIESGDGKAGSEYANKALHARPGDLATMVQFTRGALMAGETAIALEAAQAAEKRQMKNQFWVAAQATALKALGRDEPYNRLYNYDLVKTYEIAAPAEYNTQADFLAALKQALIRLHDHPSRAPGQTLREGTQTFSDLRFANERVIQDFFQAIASPINAYINSLPDDNTHPLFGRKRKSYRVSNAWSVNLTGEGFHINHIHPQGWISAAFYVDVPENLSERKDKAGWIAFGKPPFAVRGHDKKLLSAEHMVAPMAGRLVLFPSYMWHGTVPLAEEDSSRLTLSLDVVPA